MTTNKLTALIAGGTSGIGRATANKLAQLGIHVLAVGRNRNAVRKPLPKYAQAEAKRTLFRLTCEMRRARAKWRQQRWDSVSAMSIF